LRALIKAEVAVVGGGPAGSIAALVLARLGAKARSKGANSIFDREA
jgi:thioredoxin reductase